MSTADDLASRLVWILGSPRTGGNRLLDLICDPLRVDRRAPTGFNSLAGDGAEIDAIPVDELMLANHLDPLVGGPELRGERWHPKGLREEGAGRAGYLFADGHADAWKPELRRLALARLQSSVDKAPDSGLTIAERPFVVINETAGSHAAEPLMDLFGDSWMIMLLRDWRDCVDAALRAWRRDGWATALATAAGVDPDEADERRLSMTGQLARMFASNIDATAAAYEAHDPDRRLEIRYEDLLDDTLLEAGRIFERLELPRSRERLLRLSGMHSFPGTHGAWRQNLAPEEQDLANEILGKRLERYGYESAPGPRGESG